MRSILIWCVLTVALGAPLIAAGFSPLLAWREPIYIAAGFAGIAGFVLMVLQPLLAAGYLPGIASSLGRRIHRLTGVLLLGAVVLHIVGLWITSPPDVVDALLLRSPTSFSIWGVVAMWALFLAAILAARRHKLGLRLWRKGHSLLVTLAVVGTVIHVLLIDGTMEAFTKLLLCALALAAIGKALFDLKAWGRRPHRKRG